MKKQGAKKRGPKKTKKKGSPSGLGISGEGTGTAGGVVTVRPPTVTPSIPAPCVDAEFGSLLDSLEEDYMSRRLSLQELRSVDRGDLARRQSVVRERSIRASCGGGRRASASSSSSISISVDPRTGSADGNGRLNPTAPLQSLHEEGRTASHGDMAAATDGLSVTTPVTTTPSTRADPTAVDASLLSSASGRWQFPHKPSAADFDFLEGLGRGAYAEVCVAEYRATGELFAVKMMNKRHLLLHNKGAAARRERDILLEVDHPGLVRLHGTFQDDGNIYLVTELMPHGELAPFIRGASLTLFEMRVFLAQQCDALDYLHRNLIVHRDFKPENVLFDLDWRTKLADFGCARHVDRSRPRWNSFVGSPEYLPPELLNDKEAGFEADFWSLGCVAYQMLAGQPPFRGASEFLTFRAVQAHRFADPMPGAKAGPDRRCGGADSQPHASDGEDHDASAVPAEPVDRSPWPSLAEFPEPARDLVESLLTADPGQRPGASGVRKHPFFAGRPWDDWLTASVAPLKDHSADGVAGGDGSGRPTSPTDDLCWYYDEEDEDDGTVGLTQSAQDREQRRIEALRDQQSSIWARFLKPGSDELIVFNGLVDLKRKKALLEPMRKRQLILTDYPRLIYISVDKMELKGAIPWRGRATQLRLVDNGAGFEITADEVYRIRPRTGSAQHWIDAINKQID